MYQNVPKCTRKVKRFKCIEIVPKCHFGNATINKVVIWPKGRHMAQIEGLDLVHQNRVTKSAAKCRHHENFRFESRSLPQNPKIFFSQISPNQ